MCVFVCVRLYRYSCICIIFVSWVWHYVKYFFFWTNFRRLLWKLCLWLEMAMSHLAHLFLIWLLLSQPTQEWLQRQVTQTREAALHQGLMEHHWLISEPGSPAMQTEVLGNDCWAYQEELLLTFALADF